jgi:hypothetical protein
VYKRTLKDSSKNKERRIYPRVFIDLPLDYQDIDDSCFRGGIVVNASEGGLLIESIRDIPVDTELNIAVLYPKGFELANFKVTAKIVWKKPYWKDDLRGDQYWKGYQCGLKFIQILEEDRRKLKLLLSDRYNLEKMLTINEVRTSTKTELSQVRR